MTISASGAFTTGNTGGATTLGGISTPVVGSIRIVTALVDSATITMSSISGGGVTTWARATSSSNTTPAENFELWWGKVTGSTGTTLTFTWSSSVTNNGVEYSDQQFSTTLSTPVWSVDVTGTTSGSGTAITYPSLTPTTANGEVYRGYTFCTNTGAAGTTTGYTYSLTANNNVLCYNTGVTAATAPTATQSPTGNWSSMAAIFSDGSSQTITASDTGTGSDSASVKATLTGTDTGTGADTASATQTVTSSDTGAGASGQTLAATLPAADTGAGAEQASIKDQNGNTLVFPNDTGVGTEGQAIIAVTVLAFETATGTESSSQGIQGALPPGRRIARLLAETRKTPVGSETRTLVIPAAL